MSWFDDNPYLIADSDSLSMLEMSGLTYRYDTERYYVVSDALSVRVLNADGSADGSDITLPSSIMDDTEGIAWIEGDKFAILDEGDTVPSSVKLHILELPEGITSVDAADVTTYDLDDIETFAGGLGAEGVAWDRVRDLFYIAVQSTADGDGALWEVDIYDDSGTPRQTRLFYWYDVLVTPGHVVAGEYVSDLAFAGDISSEDRLFVLTRGTTRKVFEIALVDGEVLSEFEHGHAGQIEGVAFDPVSLDLALVGEPTLTNFWRYSTTQPVLTQTAEDRLEMLALNNAGNSIENPAVEGYSARLSLAKPGVGTTLRKCWMTVDDEITQVLTASCVENDETITLDVETGVELEAGTPAVLNIIHITTSDGVHGYARYGIWVAERPPHVIELDGYDGQDSDEPIIYPGLA